MNQKDTIIKFIKECLDKGMKDKQKIFTKAVEELDVPRPTVRRCARDLKNDFLDKIKILQGDITG